MTLFELTVFVFLALIILLVVLFFFKVLVIIRPFERALIERFGKYEKTAGAGVLFLIPFAETATKFDIREKLIDVPPQEVITKDNASVEVDAIVYFEIFDPIKVVYNVSNFSEAATKLAQTTLRDVIGSMELDETLISRERINTTLKKVLDVATDKWGVKVTRVEIKKIDPPAEIKEAMSKQMIAERTRRAAILEAEGKKQAAILESEGLKQAAVREAEGKTEAIRRISYAKREEEIVISEGKAKAIEAIYSAIHIGRPTNDLIAIKYLETLQKVADGNATKIFLPMETSGILGSVSAIGDIFKDMAESPASKKNQKIKKNCIKS